MPLAVEPKKKPALSAVAPNKGRTKSWLRQGLEVAGAAVLVIAGLELVFAWAGIGEQEYLKPDPIVGACGIPGKFVTQRKEGFGKFKYNNFGMNDVERSLLKPAGTKRIVVLGDSVTEALQVDRPLNYCSLFEQKLNAGGNGRFEVLNYGVSMTNLAQMYLRMKHRVFQFQPDVVIVPVRVDAALQLTPDAKSGFLTARPNFFADGKGDVIEDRTVQQLWLKSPEGKRMRMTGWLREHSHIWGVISQGIEQFAGWMKTAKEGTAHWGAEVTKKQTAFAPGAASPAAASIVPAVAGNTAVPATSNTATAAPVTKPVTPPVQSPAPNAPDTRYFAAATKYEWQVVDPLIRRMKAECDAHNCKLVLLRLPGGNDWRNDLETELLHKSAEHYQIPVLDTTDRFHQAWLTGAQLFYATHFTPVSHELMSDELNRFFKQQGLDR